jgi:RNA 3'-phosphate cyclase
LEVDGSKKSGSGTILRLSVALATLLGETLHIYNIRKKRPKPGLRPQHLEAVLTAAKLCQGNVEGAEVSSEELWFRPGKICGGSFVSEIGTAGSIPMLILTILPICAFAKKDVEINITKGGTDVRNSPTINYLKYVLLPVLEEMGLKSELLIKSFGYFPKGAGKVTIKVKLSKNFLPLERPKAKKIDKIEGLSVCTFLKDRKVAERQAKAAKKYLKAKGYSSNINFVNDFSNIIQKGSSIVLWTKSGNKTFYGSDAIGEIRKSSEAVGREAAKRLYYELESGATVDVFLADMLIPYIALSEGKSYYYTRVVTDHLETNIWLVKKILGAKISINKQGRLFRIECDGK